MDWKDKELRIVQVNMNMNMSEIKWMWRSLISMQKEMSD